MGLAWNDLDFAAGEMRLADSKACPRIVPMPPAAAKVLAALPRTPDNRWVFPGRKKGTQNEEYPCFPVLSGRHLQQIPVVERLVPDDVPAERGNPPDDRASSITASRQDWQPGK